MKIRSRKASSPVFPPGFVMLSGASAASSSRDATRRGDVVVHYSRSICGEHGREELNAPVSIKVSRSLNEEGRVEDRI